MTKLLLVFDWETTGLLKHPDAPLREQPRAIEFGGALVDCSNGEVVYRRAMLIHPGFDLTAEMTKYAGGITNEMLSHEGCFPERFDELSELFGRATTMLSHNLPFDKGILVGELARLGEGYDAASFPWPKQEFCTVGLYKEVWGRNPKLVELYEHVLGKPLAQTHRAMGDVEALLEIVQAERLWELVV